MSETSSSYQPSSVHHHQPSPFWLGANPLILSCNDDDDYDDNFDNNDDGDDDDDGGG